MSLPRPLLLPLIVATFVVGCQHTPDGEAPEAPPMPVKIDVTGLKKGDRDVLEKGICALEGVSECSMKVRRGKARLSFVFDGTLAQLRARIAALPHPGLRPQTRAAQLTYEGFDNIPPDVAFEKPEPGSVHTSSEIEVVVKTEAPDVEAVMIDGEVATRLEKGLYLRHLTLPDGSKNVEAVVIDDSGNAGRAGLSVVIDTTPPTVKVTVQVQGDRALLKGEAEDAARVMIDGRETSVGMLGGFSANLPVDPDKKKAEIVAIDEHGNEAVIYAELKDGWTGQAPE